jgi:hypothetical protein
MNPKDIGSVLAVVGSGISIIGVVANNVFLAHHEAMIAWGFSNLILLTFFYGQYRNWWNGALSSATLCILYLIFSITGFYGLSIGG